MTESKVRELPKLPNIWDESDNQAVDVEALVQGPHLCVKKYKAATLEERYAHTEHLLLVQQLSPFIARGIDDIPPFGTANKRILDSRENLNGYIDKGIQWGCRVRDALESLRDAPGDAEQPSHIAVVYSEAEGLAMHAAHKVLDDFLDYKAWYRNEEYFSRVGAVSCKCLFVACDTCRREYHYRRAREKVDEHYAALLDLRGKNDDLQAYASELERLGAELADGYRQDLERWKAAQPPPPAPANDMGPGWPADLCFDEDFSTDSEDDGPARVMVPIIMFASQPMTQAQSPK